MAEESLKQFLDLEGLTFYDGKIKAYIDDADAEIKTKLVYNNDTQLQKDIGGILASNHPNGFDNVPINDIITELLYPYTPAEIKDFKLNPSAGVKQKNKEFTVTSATVTVIKKSNAIKSVRLYKNTNTQPINEIETDEITSEGTTLTFTINDTLDTAEDLITYQIKVIEEGDKIINSNTLTYKFVYPYFYGVVDANTTITSDTILNFKEVIRDKGSHSYEYTTANQCPVIAYPESYGALKSIVDPNNFTQAWTQNTVVVNNGDTIKNQKYYVYVGGAATATAKYTFNYQ